MEKNKITFGSVCSGIEAAHLAFEDYNFKQLWSSEIAEFPKLVLKHHYPNIPNLGDMNILPNLILNREIQAPKLLCGGTPCQAFSLAGWKKGLNDDRGLLSMKFIEIADAIDKIRNEDNNDSSIILWENVEGVLTNKTNPFGNFIASLAGMNEALEIKKWTKAGYLEGPKRNVAWRVIDAKFFGLPQQRKRLFVLAGDKCFRPDLVLFEFDNQNSLLNTNYNIQNSINQLSLFSERSNDLIFHKDGFKYEAFREYTDCLYSAYGTKWNGNAAAYNGSLFIAQNDRIRRLKPIECERLMGFPDNYTKILGCSNTVRYQAVGNSWAIPVVKWIAKRLNNFTNINKKYCNWYNLATCEVNNLNCKLYLLNEKTRFSFSINVSNRPNIVKKGFLIDIVESENNSEKIYLSKKACLGILRRKSEKGLKMNESLEKLLKLQSN